jgi:TrmH family RNA methyltransferase
MHILKQLKTKKGRDETGLFIVEGSTFVAEIPADWPVVRYIFSEGYAAKHGAEVTLYKNRAPVQILRDALFESYAPALTPQGIVAVCKQKKYKINDFPPAGSVDEGNPFLILGENLQDPGNIGTLIRTAAAAGARGMLLTAGSADVYSPKVQRAAAGAALRLPVVTDVSLAATCARFEHKLPLYAAHPRGDVLPYDLDMKKGFVLLIGSEAHGLSDEALAMADALVRLPMADESESLNASVAGSILLYEAVRQRLVI